MLMGLAIESLPDWRGNMRRELPSVDPRLAMSGDISAARMRLSDVLSGRDKPESMRSLLSDDSQHEYNHFVNTLSPLTDSSQRVQTLSERSSSDWTLSGREHRNT
jgi:hypothetical protein